MRKISTLLLATTMMSANICGVPVVERDINGISTLQELKSKFDPKTVEELIKGHNLTRQKKVWNDAYTAFTDKKTTVNDAGIQKIYDIVANGKIDCDDMPETERELQDYLGKKLDGANKAWNEHNQVLSNLEGEKDAHKFSGKVKQKFFELMAAEDDKKPTNKKKFEKMPSNEDGKGSPDPRKPNGGLEISDKVRKIIVKSAQKYMGDISSTFASLDYEKSPSEEQQNQMMSEVSKSLPNISNLLVKVEREKLGFDAVIAEVLQINASNPEEFLKVDEVYSKTLADLSCFKAHIIQELDKIPIKKSDMSDEKKEQMQKALEIVSVLKLPKTKNILITEYDYLFDYIAKAAGEEVKQAVLAAFAVDTKVAEDMKSMKTIAEMDAYESEAKAKLTQLEEEAKKDPSKSVDLEKLKAQIASVEGAKSNQISQERSNGNHAVNAVVNQVSTVATQVVNIVSERMGEMNTPGVSSGSEDSSMKFGPWVQGFGGIAKQDVSNRKLVTPFELWNAGFVIGCDFEVSEKVFVGVGGIYSRANVQFYDTNNKLNETANIFNNFGGIIYGQFMPTENISLDAQGSFIVNKMKLELGTEKSAKIGFGSVSAKYYIPLAAVTIVPKVGFNGLKGSYDIDAVDSKDKGSKLNGDVSKMAVNLGLAFQKSIMTEGGMKITPELRIGAEYMLAGNARGVDNIAGLGVGEKKQDMLTLGTKSAVSVGASLSVKKSESFDVTFGVDAMATGTHLAAKMGFDSVKEAKIDGDFYSVNGYLKVKLSL
jgi:hypothetical protein